MWQFRNLIEPWPEKLSGNGDEEFAKDTARTYTATFQNDEKGYAVKGAQIFKDMVQKQTT